MDFSELRCDHSNIELVIFNEGGVEKTDCLICQNCHEEFEIHPMPVKEFFGFSQV